MPSSRRLLELCTELLRPIACAEWKGEICKVDVRTESCCNHLVVRSSNMSGDQDLKQFSIIVRGPLELWEALDHVGGAVGLIRMGLGFG